MNKKIPIIMLLIISVFTLTACNNKKEELTDKEKFKQEYEKLNGEVNEKYDVEYRSLDIPEDNPFVYKEAKDIVEAIDNKETFVVYFGFSECPWCRSVISSLIDVANDLNLKKIYYVNVQDIRDTIEITEEGALETTKEGTEDYYKLLEYLDEVLEDYNLTDENDNKVSTGEKRIYAPNVVSVVDGKVKELETGIVDELTDPYMELTDDIKDKIYNTFECSIKCVVEEKNTCSKNAC